MVKKFARVGGVAAAATASAFLFAACGGGTTEVISEPMVDVTTPADETVVVEETTTAPGQCEGLSGTINFRWWGSDDRAALQNEAIAAFQELNPDVEFNIMPVAFAGYWDQLGVEAAAGNLPDVFTANVEWIGTMAPAGVLANLSNSQYVDLAPISDALSEVTYNGNVYALPTGLNAASLLVDLDLLEEAGIEVPDDNTWSWDDFAAIAQQVSDAGLTNASGDSVFGVAHLGGQQVARVWANQTDGGMFDADGNLNWSEESIAAYLEFVAGLEASGAAPGASLQSEVGTLSPDESLMALGRAAFQPQWSNQLNAVANVADGNIGLLRFPGDSTEPHVGTWLRPSMTFAVAANAQSPEAAECFVNFMVNSEEAAQIMGIDRGIPLNPELFDLVVPGLTGANAEQAAFIEKIAADPGASTPMPELSDDLNNVLLTQTEAVLFGTTTPEAGAAALRSNLQNALVN